MSPPVSPGSALRSLAARLLQPRYEEYVAMVALLIVVGSVLWGVLTRYLFAQPAPWSYEVATIGFAWLVFFAAAAGVRHRLHADIDVFTNLLGPRWQRLIGAFNFCLLAVFFATLCVLCAIHTVDAHKSNTIALNIPRSMIYLPLCVATGIMFVRHLQVWFLREHPAFGAHEANIT